MQREKYAEKMFLYNKMANKLDNKYSWNFIKDNKIYIIIIL